MLPSETLGLEEKKRFLTEIPAGACTLKLHKKVVRRLRVEVGDTVSDSEEEIIETVA